MSVGVSMLGLLGALGCTNGEGNEPNVLPDPSGGGSTTATTSTPTSSTTAVAEASSDSGSETEAPADDTPKTYRFDCIDIQGVGDADGSAIQAQVLENTWSNDIDLFKLNIMLEVESRDFEAGEAQLGIRSGVGPDGSGLCAEENTISDLIPVSFVQGETRWAGSTAVGECSTPSSGTSGNSYEMQLPPERVVYIYAEDDDTTTFNCTPDAGTPDAVPIRAVQAEVSTDANENVIWGTLDGCLLQSDAAALCSCLGSCGGSGPDDLQTEGECAGCPTGGNPLEVLLGGVNPSDNCTSVMGAPAFDLTIGFSGSKLPNVPTACG